MMRPRDPRVRQTINQISHNLETANESAQEGLYTFSHNYLVPCLSTIGNCIYTCASPCLPSREDHIRRRRRGRAEANFDFYDDWDNDDSTTDGLLGWGTDELDRLLAGSGLTRAAGSEAEQPRRQRRMSYGARRARRKSTILDPDARNDPTVIPSSSFLGFLERFPWRLGARGVKYRPSVADLQEHPTALRRAGYEHVHDDEHEPLMEAAEENAERGEAKGKNSGRYRSSTQSSRETANSLSSRGDLIPSDEEEDAVPLDDEFAMALGSRRWTGLESDDQLGDKPESTRSVSGTFSLASKDSNKRKNKKKRSSGLRSPSSKLEVAQDIAAPTIADMKQEEDRAAMEEESEIIRKRLAARQLASHRGLNQAKKSQPASQSSLRSPTRSVNDHHESTANTPGGGSDVSTEPFPPMPSSPQSGEAVTGHDMGVVDHSGSTKDQSTRPPDEH